MEKNKTIASETLTEKTEIRFTLDNVGGKELAQIRVWFKTESGEFVPTRKGVAFPRTKIQGIALGVTKLLNEIQGD